MQSKFITADKENSSALYFVYGCKSCTVIYEYGRFIYEVRRISRCRRVLGRFSDKRARNQGAGGDFT